MDDDFDGHLERMKRSHMPASLPRYECRKCQDTGYVYVSDEGQGMVAPCSCFEIRKAKDMMRRSGITGEFQSKNFDNFETKGDDRLQNAKSKSEQYAKKFAASERDRRNSIMFCGQVGAGKTHLGTAICGQLMASGVAVIYMAYRNAITKLKQTITDEENYERELSQYISARVLYIDDFLKGRLTEADVNIMYEIVNARYMQSRPIILSTEKSPNDLLVFDEAIGSRLIEMCRGNIIELQGKELNHRLS